MLLSSITDESSGESVQSTRNMIEQLCCNISLQEEGKRGSPESTYHLREVEFDAAAFRFRWWISQLFCYRFHDRENGVEKKA